MRATFFSALVITLIALVSPARAGERDAKTFFAEGRRLRLAGQCDAAVEAFEKALEAYPEGLGSLRNIAECEEELGRYASARRHYWDLRVAVLASGAPRYEGWVQDAEAGHARLANQVAKLVVEVVGPGAAEAVIEVDDERLDDALRGAELERDPGVHQIVALVNGRPVGRSEIRVESGERKVVTLQVDETSREPAPKGAALPPTRSPPRDGGPEDEGPSGMYIGGIVATAVGGASVIGLGVAIGLRQAALSDLENVCPNYETSVCAPTADGPTSQGQTASTLINVFAPLAAVATATGITLLLVGGSVDGSDEPSADTGLRVRLGPGGATLTGRF